MKKTPIKRTVRPARRTAVKRKRATPRRVSVDRDKDYLAFLREQGCVVCARDKSQRNRDRTKFLQIGLSDPAHGPVNGAGSKGADSGAIPLCRMHHDEQHATPGGWKVFEAKYSFSREKEAAAFQAVYRIAEGTTATDSMPESSVARKTSC